MCDLIQLKSRKQVDICCIFDAQIIFVPDSNVDVKNSFGKLVIKSSDETSLTPSGSIGQTAANSFAFAPSATVPAGGWSSTRSLYPTDTRRYSLRPTSVRYPDTSLAASGRDADGHAGADDNYVSTRHDERPLSCFVASSRNDNNNNNNNDDDESTSEQANASQTPAATAKTTRRASDESTGSSSNRSATAAAPQSAPAVRKASHTDETLNNTHANGQRD